MDTLETSAIALMQLKNNADFILFVSSKKNKKNNYFFSLIIACVEISKIHL